MIKNTFVSVIIGFAGIVGSAFAQLDGDYTPDLSSIELPVFDGVLLEDTVSATTFSIEMTQGLTSSKLTGSGEVDATDFYADDTLTVNFSGSMTFSAAAALSGSIVRLTGAKAVLGKDVTGTGTYTDEQDGDLSVTVTKVTGSFGFKRLTVNLDEETIDGDISPGSISVSGYLDDNPSQKGTVRVKYDQDPFGPYDFPSDNIITPEIALTLATSTRNAVTGSATGLFGDYDEVAFNLRGRLNAKSGISTITLTGTGAGKGVSATLNLDENGEITGTRNALNVLGYKLRF